MKMILLLFVGFYCSLACWPMASALSPSNLEPQCPPMPDVTCEIDEVKCPAELGFDGCPIDAPECLPIGMCDDSPFPLEPQVECPEPKEPECNPYQVWCDLGNDTNGCWLGGECAAKCAKEDTGDSSENKS